MPRLEPGDVCGIWEVIREIQPGRPARRGSRVLYEVRCRRCGSTAARSAVDVRKNRGGWCGACAGKILFRGKWVDHAEISRVLDVPWSVLEYRLERNGMDVEAAAEDARRTAPKPRAKRVCPECKRELPPEMFHGKGNGKAGKNKRCAECLDAVRKRAEGERFEVGTVCGTWEVLAPVEGLDFYLVRCVRCGAEARRRSSDLRLSRRCGRCFGRHEVNGRWMSVGDLAEAFGVTQRTIRERINAGMSALEAAVTPTKRRRRRADGLKACLGCGKVFSNLGSKARCNPCQYRYDRGLPSFLSMKKSTV